MSNPYYVVAMLCANALVTHERLVVIESGLIFMLSGS